MPTTLLCIIIGKPTTFTVTINEIQRVGELKDEIKKRHQLDIASQLILYKVNIDVSNESYERETLAISQSSIEYKKEELEGWYNVMFLAELAKRGGPEART
jgi:hypothetical protein